jgi:CheY-like chemotaxis protein
VKRDPLILLVEDSPEDYEVTVRSLRRAGYTQELHHCQSGDDALARLRSDPRPNLVLLDLNLPGLDGREVLAEIKQDARLRSIPVAVLTTSDSPADVEACYQAGANCYLVKPVDLERFERTVRSLREFWLECVVLP